MLSGSVDSTLTLWDFETGEIIHRLIGHSDQITTAVLSDDGAWALSGSLDKNVILWDLEQGQEIRRWVGGPFLNSVAFCLDNQAVIASSWSDEGSLALYDIETGDTIYRVDPLDTNVFRTAVNIDGHTALLLLNGSQLVLWDIESGQLIRQFSGLSGLNGNAAIDISPDGLTALSPPVWNDTRQGIILWDMTSGEEVRRFYGHPDPIYGLVFSPDGKTFLSSTATEVRQWDLQNGIELGRLANPSTSRRSVIAFSPDGYTALTGGGTWDAGNLVLWNVDTQQPIRTFASEQHGAVWSIAFSPDGQTAASGASYADPNTILALWDVRTGDAVRYFIGHTDTIMSVHFSPDGHTLISSSLDGTLRRWDVETGAEINEYPAGFSILSTTLSPDGKTLAFSLDVPSNVIVLLNVETLEVIRTLLGHSGIVTSVAFSSDGQTLLSGSVDGSIRLWNADSGAEIGRFEGHFGPVYSVAFSPDGVFAISGAGDRSLRAWNIDTGAEILRIDGFSDALTGAMFGPDGETMFTTTVDEAGFHLWRFLTGADLVAWAHNNRYVRDFTCAEREHYRIEPACGENVVSPTNTPYTEYLIPSAVPDYSQ